MAITGSLQTKNGKYYAVLNLKDEQGKRKQKWINTKYDVKGNKKKAESFLREQLVELNKQDIPYCQITVADYFEK